MEANRELATWLVSSRAAIEKVMSRRLGPAAPAPADPESEALRRFRSFAAAALLRGQTSAPALDGLRTNDKRMVALLSAWTESAGEVAGPTGPALERALAPLVDQFKLSLRGTQTSRRASGAPRRSTRRAVTAAIDRVADAFLAIDTETGRIADANPAAGSLLNLDRDALLGVDAMSFVPEPARQTWWDELDAVSEGGEPRMFRSFLLDAGGGRVQVDARVTRFNTRSKSLALVMARPLSDTT